MSTVPSLALEALEIISIRNQKELKLLAWRLKIYIVVLLDKMLKKLTVIFFNFIFFLEKKVQSDTPLRSHFPNILNLFSLANSLKSNEG